MPGRRSDAQASRAAILAAARRCFSAKGFAGTSMGDIAGAANVTQSLIHHHFEAKAPLWRHVLADAFEAYRAQRRAGPPPSEPARDAEPAEPVGLQRVRRALTDDFRFLAAHADILRLMAWAELEGVQEFATTVAELRAHGVARLVAAQRAGLVRGDIPAQHIFTALVGLSRTWFEERHLVVDEDDVSATRAAGEAFVEAAWAVVHSGVLAAPRPTGTAGSAP